MNAPMDSMRSRDRKVSFEIGRAELGALNMKELSALFCHVSTLESVLCAMTNAPWYEGTASGTMNGVGAVIERLHSATWSLIALTGDVAARAQLKENDAEAAEVRAYILLKHEADLGGDDFGSTALMAVEQMYAIGIAADKASGVRPEGRAA